MWAMSNNAGRIIAVYQGGPGQTQAKLEEIYGNNFIEGASDDAITGESMWVNNGVLEDKASLTATWDATTVVADGVAEIVLSGLPVPCTAIIDHEQTVVVTDGSLEFSADVAATYSIIVDEVAFIRKEWTVSAS